MDKGPGLSSGVYSLTLGEGPGLPGGPGRGRGKVGLEKRIAMKEKSEQKNKKIIGKQIGERNETKRKY